MSRNTFTVTVILKAFFADCRAQAKIFISENIETILDLEKKISRIFAIKDFHLLSNEKLLPSCEDIRLLDSGDIVCVSPNEHQPNTLILPERFYTKNKETSECKKKKRQNLDDECPIKGKKCKKKRKETTFISDEKFHDLGEINDTNKLEKIPNELKKKRKKDKSEVNINIIPHPEQNDCQFFTSTPHEIKNNNTYHESHVENQNKNALVYGKISDSVNLKKFGEKKCRLTNEHSTKTLRDKQKTINHLSNENADSNSEIELVSQYSSEDSTEKSASTKFFSAGDSHSKTTFVPKPTSKTKELTYIELNSTTGNSSKIIVDNSSSRSENETEEKICRNSQPPKTKSKNKINKNESEMNKMENLNQYHSTDQSKLKIGSENKSIGSKNDSRKIQKKGCSFYPLPVKKKHCKSWSTSPLLKTTNHVKIERVPIMVSDIDLSKFLFNPSDVGAVPVPKTETVGECIVNDIYSLNLSKPLINISQHNSSCLSQTGNISIQEFSLSECDKDESKFNTISKKKIDVEEQTAEEFHQSSNEEHCMISTYMPKHTENVHPLASDKVVNNKLENLNENVTNKNIVLKNWRQSILDKLTDSTQNSVQNVKGTLSVVNEEILEKNEDVPCDNPSNQFLKSSSEIMKLNTNSYKARKGNRLNELGISYYLNLLDKNDWDVTKSVSNIDAQEVNSQSETKEEVIYEKPLGLIDNEKQLLENMDLSSISSTGNDFITKRKRKRKHKKKVRVDTPVPIKRSDFQPSKLTLVRGNPKVHIRFQSDENDYPAAEDNAVHNEASVNFDESDGKVKVLQNVSLDLSEGNLSYIASSFAETDNGGSNISTVISPYNNVDKFKTGEKELEDFSISTDDNAKTKLSQPYLLDSAQLNGENEKAVLNIQLSNSSNNDNNKNPKSFRGFQRIPLDYTNQNLTSNESDKLVLNSSSNELKSSNTTCQDKALENAKLALLEAVGCLTPDREIIQNITESDEGCRELSIINVTEDIVVST